MANKNVEEIIKYANARLLNDIDKRLEARLNELFEKFDLRLHEKDIEASDIKAQISALGESLSSGAKKTTPAKPAQKTKANEIVPKKGFYINKMIWCKRLFQEDAEFRENLIKQVEDKKPSIRNDMANDGSIAKKKGDEKLKAMSNFIWTHIKNNDKELLNKLDTEFNNKKNEYNLNNKPDQVTAENHTPQD